MHGMNNYDRLALVLIFPAGGLAWLMTDHWQAWVVCALLALLVGIVGSAQGVGDRMRRERLPVRDGVTAHTCGKPCDRPGGHNWPSDIGTALHQAMEKFDADDQGKREKF